MSLYLGAGFSVYAENSYGKLPTGSDLKQELVDEFSLQDLAELELDQLSSVLKSTNSTALDQFLRKRFDVTKFDPAYRVIRKIRLDSIFCVNIDNLVHKIFDYASTYFLQDITLHGVSRSNEAISYIPLHGCISNPTQELNFSTIDVASSNVIDADRWKFLADRIQKSPILFWGTRLIDNGVLSALNSKTIDGRVHQPKWIILRERNAAKEAYYKSLGFAIICGETKDILEYFSKVCEVSDPALAVFSDRETRKLFPENSIPSPASVAVRPVLEFLSGASPTWHDIFTNQIPKTSCFDRVLDVVNSRSNAIIMGIPFSGKSTLMMQVAHELNVSKHKLVFQNVSLEQACAVVSRLSGEEAIIFIDDFADSLDAFNEFKCHENIQVIGFDRDVNYEIISHLIDRKGLKIIDVTSLEQADLQKLFMAVPSDARVSIMKVPETAQGVKPSLFEFVEANVSRPSLRDRMPAMVSRIREIKPELVDLFALFCYVNECRVPVSISMLWSYLEGRFNDYKDIRSMIEELGSLISTLSDHDITGFGLEGVNEDHYQMRSRIFSESGLSAVSDAEFKYMLERFHYQVSPYRIVAFDTFQKMAYRSRLIERAFPDVADGERFYQDCYNRNHERKPYFILQHGAMYLATRSKFKKAFVWIDQAVTESGGNLSIRNTHAKLLFRANIHADHDDLHANHTLCQSMDILSELYEKDDRKNYHVETFAKQAIDFYKRFRNQQALDYLATAKIWLEFEIRDSPWNKYLQRRLRSINIILEREGDL